MRQIFANEVSTPEKVAIGRVLSPMTSILSDLDTLDTINEVARYRISRRANLILDERFLGNANLR
jgi:hypothetical protein